MIYQAHKGVSTENPENTMPAFEAAIRQGYGIIETDVGVTADMQFVTIHDSTVNRTARLKNGDVIHETVSVSESTYAELLNYDFGISFSKKFRGTEIPLFDNALAFARKNGIKLKIDNKYQGFKSEQRTAFFKLIKPYSDIAQLTCSSVEELKRITAVFPEMSFHYDGEVTDGVLSQIGELCSKERITVWLPHKNRNTSWVRVGFATAEKAEKIKRYARLGIWILSENGQLDEIKALKPDIIETNGQLKPPCNFGIKADMHTHSEASHDSVCPMEDMAASQLEKGTKIFAVTDHLDTDSYNDYNVLDPIVGSVNAARKLNKKLDGRCTVLSGVEISEGFWHPEIYKKALSSADYDVIIGSVHLVKYSELTRAYSQIDFSRLSETEIADYLDAYFDDISSMLDFADFDILAHLTCPLRYIVGKYGINIDMTRYGEKIDCILKRIIKSGIALEVNTSSLAPFGILMPDAEILKKYRAMGGYLVTVGSDAHIAENASADFDKIYGLLKKIGFKSVFYFKDRQPYQISL